MSLGSEAALHDLLSKSLAFDPHVFAYGWVQRNAQIHGALWFRFPAVQWQGLIQVLTVEWDTLMG